MVFAFTNDDADAGIFVLFSDAFVEEGKVKAHFPGVFRLEFSDFQINGNQRLQAPVEKEQINPVLLPVQIEGKLVGDKVKNRRPFPPKTGVCFGGSPVRVGVRNVGRRAPENQRHNRP